MRRHDVGPRRSRSVDALLRRTRLLAAVALLALVGGIVWDAVGGTFWARHALLAGLTSSLIIVMLTVAVVNEVLERRGRERWSVLAQFVMLELVRNARLIWMGVLAQVGLLPTDTGRPDAVDTNSRIVRDTPRLTTAVREAIADDGLRHGLHDEIAVLSIHTSETLGRWAAVMLNADVYAEVVDRHVELASGVSWLLDLLDNSDPPDDHHRRRRARSSPAVQIEGEIAGDDLAQRIVVITQLAEELDRATLDLAMRIVPLEWWEARLGTSVPTERRTATV